MCMLKVVSSETNLGIKGIIMIIMIIIKPASTLFYHLLRLAPRCPASTLVIIIEEEAACCAYFVTMKTGSCGFFIYFHGRQSDGKSDVGATSRL